MLLWASKPDLSELRWFYHRSQICLRYGPDQTWYVPDMALTINSYHIIWLTPDCSITNMAHTKLLQCGCDDGTDPMDHDGGWKASGE